MFPHCLGLEFAWCACVHAFACFSHFCVWSWCVSVQFEFPPGVPVSSHTYLASLNRP